MKFNTVSLWCLLFALLVPSSAVAQKRNFNENKQKVAKIEDSGDYYYGRGSGKKHDEAKNQALVDLMGNICSFVKQNYRSRTIESKNGSHVETTGIIDIDIRQRTGGLLTNIKELVLSDGNSYELFCYVEKKEVEKNYEALQKIASSYLAQAEESKNKRQVGDALRNYYWAYCLANFFPNPYDVKLNKNSDEFVVATRYIPIKIEEIFNELEIKAGSQDERNELEVLVKYKDKAVCGLDFICVFDSVNKAEVSANNGKALIPLPPTFDSDKVKVECEFEYKKKARQDFLLSLMMESMNGKDVFSEARKTIELGAKKDRKNVNKEIQTYVVEASQATHAVEVNNHSSYNRAMSDVIKAISTKKYEKYKDVEQHFTPEGYAMFKSLIGYGKASLIGKADVHYYESARGRVVCRSIPMSFDFPQNYRTFTEDVTFTFSPDGKIESLAFGLDNVTRETIFNSPAKWSDSVRMAIATFIENYKTAYALKDIDYIKKVFDDHAIIVVGREFMKNSRTADQELSLRKELKREVEYTMYRKEDYLNNLEKQFKTNRFINLHFSDVEIKKLPKGNDIFGIRIQQDYCSSTYSDKGYLFLIVDMNNSSQPLIKVRTWQPDRDPKINTKNLPVNHKYYGLITETFFE